ncbi:glycosyltransferase [Candidatus Acidianus copahuensis]|uniref:glycosyltransferase n=1 Tax=Candidatus Acidianus copahuensis TaxID=1160895 RepID=UPI00135F1922|nr:glycosyltransferase [Candidatus Acidianus copahuensis]
MNSFLAFHDKPKLQGNRSGSFTISDLTVVIPVYREDVNVFERVVKSLSSYKINFLVIGDGQDKPYSDIVKRYGGQFILVPHGGKRNALAEGIRRVKTKLVMFLDSDTIIELNDIKHMISLFADKVGGVNANIKIFPENSIRYYYAEFFERFKELVSRAVSRSERTIVLNGECAMYRTDIIKSFVMSKAYIEPRLFGRKIVVGDDRQLTNYIINMGYKAIFDFNAFAYTKPPKDIKEFVKQMIRWTRSNYLFFFKELFDGTLFRKGGIYTFNSIYNNLLPIIGIVTLFGISNLSYTNPLVYISILHGIIHHVYYVLFMPIHNFHIPFRLSHYGSSDYSSLRILKQFSISIFMPVRFLQHEVIREPILKIALLHLMYYMSASPYAVALGKLIGKERVKTIAYGSIGLIFQLFVAYYAILTFWKQEWITR